MTKTVQYIFAPLIILLWTTPVSAMPYNAHQNVNSYWWGGRPTAEDVPALKEAGITKVVSIVWVKRETKDALRAAGITRVTLAFGTKFPSPDRIEEALGDTPANQVYIHCRHGADRTAMVLAYVLVTRHGWDIPSAFLSVVYTNKDKGDDEAQLRALLEEEGYDTSSVPEDIPGCFSPWKNGGDGGLKIRSEGYRRMVRKTITRIKEAT